MIVIADYGLGNISSIRNMLAKCGRSDVLVTGDPGRIAAAPKLILPGVGAFDHGMSRLGEGGRSDALVEAAVRRGVPTLGICLGMQLMCRRSEEGQLPGLGWIEADVVRFRHAAGTGLKIPHMGWNTVSVRKASGVLTQDSAERRFYFVHSYHVLCRNRDDVLATAHYGHDFDAAFSRGNLYGVQFHPEKSHSFGLELMQRFADLPC